MCCQGVATLSGSWNAKKQMFPIIKMSYETESFFLEWCILKITFQNNYSLSFEIIPLTLFPWETNMQSSLINRDEFILFLPPSRIPFFLRLMVAQAWKLTDWVNNAVSVQTKTEQNIYKTSTHLELEMHTGSWKNTGDNGLVYSRIFTNNTDIQP